MRTPGKRFIIHRQVQSEQLPKAASSLLLSMTAIDSQHYASAAKNNLALDSSAVFSTFDGYFQYTATLFIPDPGVVMKFSAIVLILLLMPGCVFYYKTGDMRNSFNDADRKLAEGIGTMETFQTEASDGYAFLMRTVSDTTAIPYPVLAGYLRTMQTTIDHVKTIPPQFVELRKEFESIAKDKGRIESNKPEWDQLKPVRAKFEELVEAAKKDFDTASESGKDFTTAAQKNGVGKMSLVELKRSLMDYIQRLEQQPVDSATIISAKNAVDEILAMAGDHANVWFGPGSRFKAKFDALAGPKK